MNVDERIDAVLAAREQARVELAEKVAQQSAALGDAFGAMIEAERLFVDSPTDAAVASEAHEAFADYVAARGALKRALEAAREAYEHTVAAALEA